MELALSRGWWLWWQDEEHSRTREPSEGPEQYIGIVLPEFSYRKDEITEVVLAISGRASCREFKLFSTHWESFHEFLAED